MLGIKKKGHCILIVCFFVSGSLFAQPAEEGKKIFQAKCVACHSIGQGKRSGPDLKDVSKRREKKWITGFIQDPAKYLSTDPVAKKLLDEFKIPMPAMGVTARQAESILAYIDLQSGGASPGSDDSSSDAVGQGSLENGKDLFIGTKPLKNGGTSCISCHTVAGIGEPGGGTLGPDLTLVAQRYGTGLGQTLKTLPFPTMKGIFDEKPLVESEVNDLHAYLSSVKSAGAQEYQTNFLLYSFGGFVLFMIIFFVAWRNRIKDVRKNLVKGENK